MKVGRTKVIAPLTDTMCLVNCDETHVHMAELCYEQFGGKAFGRDIEQFQTTENSILQSLDNLLTRHSRIDGSSLDAPLQEVIYLVFHQCNQWRNYDADPFFG